MAHKKRAARTFFDKLHDHLTSRLPSSDELRRKVRETVLNAKNSQSPNDKCKAFPEGAFLNQFVIDPIHEFLKSELSLSREEACRALLSESYRSHPTIASGSPKSALRHPFTKVLGATAKSVAGRWWDKATKSCVSQSCPDLALRSPCPYTTLFEAKYFPKGGAEAAKTALVTGIYQSFYYRGLPHVEKDKRYAAWDYDFSCFLICDSTDKGSVFSAWDDVRSDISRGCWEGGNIYVMVLRGGL